MKTIDSIPTGKINRAAKILKTGAKVGVNYLKYYGEKAISPETARDNLDEANADDIYDGLKQLKGSALKVAQMLSMEKNLLPSAYSDKFSLAQFSVPPLSKPLVVKTFTDYFNQSPYDLFDVFNAESINAASIGQVHLAEKEGKKLAVKIQYPGVADSISSDLALVKPIAIKMFNLQGKGSDQYFKEVEGKLLEETDYQLEMQQSIATAKACDIIENLRFPEYYPEWSGDRILTMDWMEGVHLSEFTKTNRNQEAANQIGQALWDFYMYQMHGLRKIHADPHPGNFLVDMDNNLVAIDFGCMKEVPNSFYKPYFELADESNLGDEDFFMKKLYELEILKPEDSEQEIVLFKEMFHEMLSLFTKPFNCEVFNFAESDYFDRITELGAKYSKSTELRKANGNRGSKHFLYINRTFFGLYSLLHDLKAEVVVNNFRKYFDDTQQAVKVVNHI